MKLLILGGTGAIGIPLVNILAQRGHDVYVTTRKYRQSGHKGVKFVTGNAHDMEFLTSLLREHYDAIVDFMNYTSEEFQRRCELLLENTDHYFFLSSARVYADLEKPIKENSKRLLDTIEDKEYLKTCEYALEKAREEDCLKTSQHNNWTILRPYITYNDQRLQLGVLEKEYWLQRALRGKSIVFSKDIAERKTTLTWGDDVAMRIACLVEQDKAKGESLQITTNQFISWSDVLQCYLDTIKKVTGKSPSVHMIENTDQIANVLGNHYQACYDRLYDRIFDSSKVDMVIGKKNSYAETMEGIGMCLGKFLQGEKRFNTVNWKLEAYFDRIIGDKTPLYEISGWKQKVKYLLYRYFLVFK